MGERVSTGVRDGAEEAAVTPPHLAARELDLVVPSPVGAAAHDHSDLVPAAGCWVLHLDSVVQRSAWEEGGRGHRSGTAEPEH